MGLLIRILGAFALSLVASGAVQQAIMMAQGLDGPMAALPPLAACVALVTLVFGCALWLSRSKAAAGWTAASMLVAMLVLGVAIYLIGLSSITPGVGGNILYGLAQLVDFYFLLPAALAVPIHWLLLRGQNARQA